MNPVLKTNKIETIFEHGVTEAELLTLSDGYSESEEEYFYALDQDSAYADLYRLYGIRGDTDKALFFMEQIADIGFKNQFKMRPCCAFPPAQKRLLTPSEIEALQQDKRDSFEKMSQLYDELMPASDKTSSEAP